VFVIGAGPRLVVPGVVVLIEPDRRARLAAWLMVFVIPCGVALFQDAVVPHRFDARAVITTGFVFETSGTFRRTDSGIDAVQHVLHRLLQVVDVGSRPAAATSPDARAPVAALEEMRERACRSGRAGQPGVAPRRRPTPFRSRRRAARAPLNAARLCSPASSTTGLIIVRAAFGLL
jgi:hypothetical protein